MGEHETTPSDEVQAPAPSRVPLVLVGALALGPIYALAVHLALRAGVFESASAP